MKAKILILICFFVILIAGCSGPGENGNVNDDSPPQPAPVATQPGSMTNMTNTSVGSEDRQFMEWTTVANERIMADIQPIMESAQDENWTKLESSGFNLKNDSEQLLSSIDEYNISENMSEVREEYKKSLEEFKQSGESFELAGKNNSSEELSTAYSHLRNATDYLRNASNLLQEKFHSLHTGTMSGQMP